MCAEWHRRPATAFTEGHAATVGGRYRVEVVGATYHVNTKAVAGVKAFPDSWHREHFVKLLRAEISKSAWTCLGYAVLGTHYHVALRLEKPTLSSGFRRLNSQYARWFNVTHRRTGALWQRRFFAVIVDSDYQLLELQRYLAHNSTKASIAAEPEDWPYCHYGALVGLHPPDDLVAEDEILGLLDSSGPRARLKLREFVEDGDPRRRRGMLLRATSDDAQSPGWVTRLPAAT